MAAASISLLLSASCATSGSSVEQTLADAGVRATRVLANDADSFARRLEEGDTTAAFVATWQACGGGSAQCAIAESPGVVQAQRSELAAAVALRAQAIVGLNRAYAAFRTDVTERSGATAERAIRDAVTGTVSYASSLTRLPLGGTATLTRPLERAAGAVASAAAAQRRRNRMLDASTELGQAIAALREAMMLETRKYDALAEVLVRERIETHRALLQAGLVSGAETLRPIADRLRVPLSRDAEAIVARSAPARRAVEAMIEASERAEVRRTQLRYRAAVAALVELEQIHGRLNTGERVDLSRLDQALWNLERLADPLPTPAARTVTAPAPLPVSQPVR